MLIRQKRIRLLAAHLPKEAEGKQIVIGVRVTDLTEGQLRKAGFEVPVTEGQKVLPAVVGPSTKLNANGKELIRRDLPKEKWTQELDWTHIEFHGRDRVEVTSTVYIDRERYHRDRLPPENIELYLGKNPDGELWVFCDPIAYTAKDSPRLLTSINVFLELFGHCHVLNEKKRGTVPKVISLNWTLLPQGPQPWEKAAPHVQATLAGMKENLRRVVERHLKRIIGHGPALVAIGRGGFTGYYAFVFPSRGLTVLESKFSGNATYVLKQDNWQPVSQMTKAEILWGKLHQQRLIHKEGWDHQIDRLLGS